MFLNPLGAYLYKIMPTKILLSLGFIISFTFVFLSSFCKSFFPFVLTYGFGFTIGIGFTYFTPLFLSWEWLPRNTGLASGIILCGFGMGAFVFGFVA